MSVRGSDGISRDRHASSRGGRLDGDMVTTNKRRRGRYLGSRTGTRLQTLQAATFKHFWDEANPANGLVPDNTHLESAPASIAGVGLALAAYVVGVARGFVTRSEALQRTLTTLRFFWTSRQAADSDAIGY